MMNTITAPKPVRSKRVVFPCMTWVGRTPLFYFFKHADSLINLGNYFNNIGQNRAVLS